MISTLSTGAGEVTGRLDAPGLSTDCMVKVDSTLGDPGQTRGWDTCFLMYHQRCTGRRDLLGVADLAVLYVARWMLLVGGLREPARPPPLVDDKAGINTRYDDY